MECTNFQRMRSLLIIDGERKYKMKMIDDTNPKTAEVELLFSRNAGASSKHLMCVLPSLYAISSHDSVAGFPREDSMILLYDCRAKGLCPISFLQPCEPDTSRNPSQLARACPKPAKVFPLLGACKPFGAPESRPVKKGSDQASFVPTNFTS